MALFGFRSSFVRLGSGVNAAQARKAIEDINGTLESELQDTPGEYFVLQAAGMLLASELKAVEGGKPVESMDESLTRAKSILERFTDVPTTGSAVLAVKAQEVYDKLRRALANGAEGPMLIGHLNDYLHFVEGSHLQRRAQTNLDLPLPSLADYLGLSENINSRVPQRRRTIRVIWWLITNIVLFFAVAITNGFVIFFIALVGSCLLASWMSTPFLLGPKKQTSVRSKLINVVLVVAGAIAGALFGNGSPFYVAAMLGVVFHEMRILNRYAYGPIAAFCVPFISLLPIVPISHASYSKLVVFDDFQGMSDLVGYLVASGVLISAILLLKRDDRNLLPLVGKNEKEHGFELVGTPKWLAKALLGA